MPVPLPSATMAFASAKVIGFMQWGRNCRLQFAYQPRRIPMSTMADGKTSEDVMSVSQQS
jgi:hypothetical protein